MNKVLLEKEIMIFLMEAQAKRAADRKLDKP